MALRNASTVAGDKENSVATTLKALNNTSKSANSGGSSSHKHAKIASTPVVKGLGGGLGGSGGNRQGSRALALSDISNKATLTVPMTMAASKPVAASSSSAAGKKKGGSSSAAKRKTVLVDDDDDGVPDVEYAPPTISSPSAQLRGFDMPPFAFNTDALASFVAGLSASQPPPPPGAVDAQFDFDLDTALVASAAASTTHDWLLADD